MYHVTPWTHRYGAHLSVTPGLSMFPVVHGFRISLTDLKSAIAGA